LVTALEVFEEDRYEHDRQCPGRQEVVQEVREREAREVEVCLSARAERPADELRAYQTHDAAEEN